MLLNAKNAISIRPSASDVPRGLEFIKDGMEMKATIQEMSGKQQQKDPQDRLPSSLLIAAIAAQLPCAWHA